MIGLLVDKLLNRSIGWSIDLKNSWSVNEKKHIYIVVYCLVDWVGWLGGQLADHYVQ